MENLYNNLNKITTGGLNHNQFMIVSGVGKTRILKNLIIKNQLNLEQTEENIIKKLNKCYGRKNI